MLNLYEFKLKGFTCFQSDDAPLTFDVYMFVSGSFLLFCDFLKIIVTQLLYLSISISLQLSKVKSYNEITGLPDL